MDKLLICLLFPVVIIVIIIVAISTAVYEVEV